MSRCTIVTLVLLASFPSLSRAQAGKVSFRDDHTILVDGKPFFPIGLYYCYEELEDESGKLLRELKTYGFNTIGYYRWGTPKWKQELDRVHQAGLKVWIRGEDGFAIDNAAIEKKAREQVRQTRDHPALLFWEFQDEPILNKVSIEGSRKGYRLVKEEDPHHPLLVVEWPGAVDRFGLWKGIGDIFATDLYPIPRARGYGRLPNHDITQMRDYLTALRTAHGDRPLLLVVQGWAWEPLKDGVTGYPTPAENRFMAYQAVIHGAKGLHYYGQFHCTKPNSAAALSSEAKDPKMRDAEFAKCQRLNQRFWDQHKAFFKELSEASGIFTLRNCKPDESVTVVKAVPKYETLIESVTKQADQGLYVLTVNADKAPRTATFRLPASVAGVKQVQVQFENRDITVQDAAFTDEFAPYGVHVYRLKTR